MSSSQPGVRLRNFSAITPFSETVADLSFLEKMLNFFCDGGVAGFLFFRSLQDTLALPSKETLTPQWQGNPAM